MRRSKAFTIINGELYKRSTTGVLQRCIALEDRIALLREIHEGTYGHHACSQTLVAKAFRSGFYWLSTLYDARNIVQHCKACQLFATKPHAPVSELHTIPVAWPFAQWGLDQVGPLPKSSRGGHTYLLVAVDKFSKWIEAIPVTNQEATTAVKFFESIVYRYGVTNSIITDNGTNFTSGEFQDFAKNLGIKLKYASVAHPKSNGQVEKANGLVCGGLKKRLLRPLKHAAGAWVEELPLVLWSLRTTPNSSMGYTPFFLLFGAEAVLPTDVRYSAPRVVAYVEEDADKALADAQDLLDEARDVALARSAVYQQSLRNYHNRRVRGRSFKPGNLVLRLKQTSTSKLEPPWEGPYLVHEVIPGGAYHLRNPKTGKDVENPWNTAQLRRFYP
jgi:transposase InsO family protein